MAGAFVVLFVAVIAWFYIKGKNAKTGNATTGNKSAKRTVKPIDMTIAHHWAPEYGYRFEIVGEAKFQPDLKRIAGDHGDKYAEIEKTALLIPDSQDQYDNLSIRIDIDGNTVGFLSPPDARSFRRRLGGKKLTGRVTSCNALIVGGKLKGDGTRMQYGVKLDLKPFW